MYTEDKRISSMDLSVLADAINACPKTSIEVEGKRVLHPWVEVTTVKAWPRAIILYVNMKRDVD